MRTIKVYGDLAKKLGRYTFVADVESVAEAVKFLLANFPWLEQHISKQNYRVKSGRHLLTDEELHHPVGETETISIIPVMAGAGAVARIIIGALLIVASFLIPGVAILGVALGPILFGVGAALLLGGVAQLLTPTPKTQDITREDGDSYIFSGIVNSARPGVAIPVIYGETVVGSVTIGTAIDVAAN
jgi:predicted phage tail protein